MLNIGILALRRDLPVSALGIGRSPTPPTPRFVADKTMEVYRALPNKAIYLSAPASGGNDVSGYRTGFEQQLHVYFEYQGDTAPTAASRTTN